MKIIGVDYSENNTSICISDNFKTFDFYAITKEKTKKWTSTMASLSVNSFTYDLFYKDTFNKSKDSDYIVNQRNCLAQQCYIADKAIKYIKSKIGNDKDVYFAMEGQSFNSKNTNSLIDIANGTGIFRFLILNEILGGDIDRLFIFSPKTLKNAIGAGGNDDKGEIFHKFILDPKIDTVKDTNFFKMANANKDVIVSKGKLKDIKVVSYDMVDKVTAKGTKTIKVKRIEIQKVQHYDIASPINDMIDAYLSVLKMSQIFSSKDIV